MTARRQRGRDFTAPRSAVAFGISQDLAAAAFALLAHAYGERPEGTEPEDGGHWATFAPASIVLIATAFDQWLNHIAFGLSVRFPVLRQLAVDLGSANKHAEFRTTISGRRHEPNPDLQMAFQVRDEIVHWLPRTDQGGRSWPSWLAELEARGLVLRAVVPGTQTDAVDLTTKLHSYRLCLWVWQTLDSAADQLLSSFPEELHVEMSVASIGSEGFALHSRLTP